MGTLRTGLGNLGRNLYLAITGKDMFLELTNAARLIEWSSALHATAFPFSSVDYNGKDKGYSNEASAGFLASIYTGIPLTISSFDYVGKVDVAVKEILAVSNDEPILSFVESLGKGDVERLRNLINNISKNATSRDEVESVAKDFNKMIKSYSSRTSKIDSFEIMGIVDLVPIALGVSVPPYITIGAFTWRLLNKQMEAQKAENALIGSIFDSLNAILRASNPHAVLIHRMRNRKSLSFLQRFFKIG